MPTHLAAAARHPSALSPRAYLGACENERLGRVRVEPAPDGLRAVFGEIDGPMVPLGEHGFLIDWQPGHAPITWRFEVSDDGVEGFQWGPRPFTRVGPIGMDVTTR